ncbi:MAG: DUF4197 domain-containing protein [Candidatus Omnitrophica bacterium]|nr:DUF4197 domain-containing protein [Candidatus Omnitrophota bacterium]
MKRVITGIILSALCVYVAGNCHAASALDWLKTQSQALTSAKLSDTKIGAGLKEALKVGIENTIKTLGKQDGYLGNKAVKILMPDIIQKAEPILRGVGFGPKIDEFTLSMNRAAEKAAPVAADVFATAITDMTIDDTQKLMKGGDTAATDYFKAKTYGTLLTKFQPAVESAMNQYAVTKKFSEITAKVNTIPMVSKVTNLDLNKYVAGKALDGLFYTLAQEEKNIRTNPSARATQLLKEVFK